MFGIFYTIFTNKIDFNFSNGKKLFVLTKAFQNNRISRCNHTTVKL